jgi:hypothetical protein
VWQPPTEGLYTVVAKFGGTDSYGTSAASVALGVVANNQGATPTSTTSNTDLYVIVAAVVILIAIALATVVLRKK